MILEARDISFSYERKGAELFSNIKFKVENNERGCQDQVAMEKPHCVKFWLAIWNLAKDRFCWMESLCRRKGIVRCR